MDLEKAFVVYKTLVDQCGASPVLRPEHRYGPEDFAIEIPRDDLNDDSLQGGLKSFLAVAEKQAVELSIDHNGWAVLK